MVLSVPSIKPLPFKLDESLEIPKWRAATFWTKEPETIAWIDQYLATNTKVNTFIDVGANIGIYSLYATTVNKEVKIFAIEPIEGTFNELLKNIQLNNFSQQIVPVRAALSLVGGDGRMIGNDERGGSSGAQLTIEPSSAGVSVRTITGDQILGQLFDPLAIIKIDTDGNEYDVLCGLKRSFEMDLIESVLVETTSVNVVQIDEYLKSHNFIEDTAYLDIEGHSNHRRINSGNRERTKIYLRSGF